MVTICISIAAFASLLGIPTGVKSSAIGLKITTWIKKYKSITKIKKKKYDKLVLFAKSKLNSIEVLTSMDSDILSIFRGIFLKFPNFDDNKIGDNNPVPIHLW